MAGLDLKRLLPWFFAFLGVLLVGAAVWSYFSLGSGRKGDGEQEGSVDVEFLWEMTKEFSAEYWYLYLILFVMVLIYAPLSTIGIANASTYFSSFMEKDDRTQPRGRHLRGWYVFLLVLVVTMTLFVGRNYMREIMFPRALSLITARMYDRYLENHETSAESAVDENLGDVLFSMRQVSDNAAWIIVYWWTDVLTIVVMMVMLTLYLLRINRTLGLASLVFSLVVIVSGIVYNIQLVRKVNAYLDAEREVMLTGEQYIVNAGMISAFGLRDNLTNEMAGVSENLSEIRNDFTSAEHAFYSTWRVVIILFFAFIFYKTLHDRKIDAGTMTRLIFVLLLFMTFLTDMSTEMIDKAWRFASVANDNSARFFRRSEAAKADDAKRSSAAVWGGTARRKASHSSHSSHATNPPSSPAASFRSLDVEHVDFGYGDNEPTLSDVTLRAQPGDLVVIKGKSGSGKSTFLKILAALEMPTSGKVTLDGVDMATVQKRAWRERVLYVSQKWGLFNGSILDNILLGSGASNVSARDMQAFVNRYGLQDVVPNVGAKVGKAASTGGGSMSGGMGKVIVLLRTVVRVMPEETFRRHFGKKPRRVMSMPCVILFDEPLAALDKHSAVKAKKMLVENIKLPHTASFFIMHSDSMDDAATLVLDWSPNAEPESERPGSDDELHADHLEQGQETEDKNKDEAEHEDKAELSVRGAELLRAIF